MGDYRCLADENNEKFKKSKFPEFFHDYLFILHLLSFFNANLDSMRNFLSECIVLIIILGCILLKIQVFEVKKVPFAVKLACNAKGGELITHGRLHVFKFYVPQVLANI